MSKGLRRSRLLLARSALLMAFSTPPLDPEALSVDGHADCEHFAGLSTMTINPGFACSMQVEG
uniref:hypothetical protein n=1 Tax=Steroidobacter agaridevorans TaxID=2695856 RepID=UPI001379877A|nr:hypothetical protein [Steroidobacter agaridevorans]